MKIRFETVLNKALLFIMLELQSLGEKKISASYNGVSTVFRVDE